MTLGYKKNENTLPVCLINLDYLHESSLYQYFFSQLDLCLVRGHKQTALKGSQVQGLGGVSASHSRQHTRLQWSLKGI